MKDKVHVEMHKGLDIINHGYRIRMEIWEQEILFSWRWWFGVGITLFAWILWLFIHKRDSSDRLLYSGMFVACISIALDAIGMQLKAWHYLYPVVPVIPSYLPYDLAIMPVTVMIIIQVKPYIKPIYKAIFFALLAAFVGEPFFKWIKIYDPINWKYIYSIPFYLIIYLIADMLSRRTHFNKIT